MRLLKQRNNVSLYIRDKVFYVIKGREKLTCTNGIIGLYYFQQTANIK